MIFSAPVFVWFFLPLCLLVCLVILPRQRQNLGLLIFSLLFYIWGEGVFVLYMLTSIVFNYTVAWFIRQTPRRNWALAFGVMANLIGLLYYKYAGFGIEVWHNAGLPLSDSLYYQFATVHMPLGISFFTFQNISYLTDVYRREVEPQSNPFRYALYISFFPQLIAGPIIRYRDVAHQLAHRLSTHQDAILGARRFLTGLAKKVILADNIGEYVNHALLIPGDQLGLYTGWLIPFGYALQLYFDFSGYSDMAIGMGRIFGLRFLENFRFPYIAHSFREYWRRWHISLSTWFRDYVYLPLGGNRKGRLRTYLNLWIIFPLVGLWHGANWNCLLFGIIHGSLMVVERLGFEKWLNKRRWVAHPYFILLYLGSLAVFTTKGLGHARDVLKAMLGMNAPTNPYYAWNMYFSPALVLWLTLATLFSLPVKDWLRKKLQALPPNQLAWMESYFPPLRFAWFLLLAVLSAGEIAGSTYNAFIYFKF